MDFYSLHLLVNQLAKHPQIHPNTQIEVEFVEETHYEDEPPTTTLCHEPVAAISVEPGKLVFSTHEKHNAVAR